MTVINLGRMCIHFPELLFLLKCHENVFFSKTTQNKVPLFPWKCSFCYVLFGDCPYFLNKILNQLYSNKLRNCNPNDKYLYTYLIYIYLSICLSIYLSIYLAIYHLSLSLSLYIYIYMYIYIIYNIYRYIDIDIDR